MKAALILLAATAGLAACHADSTKDASPSQPTVTATAPSSKADTSMEKSRDSLLDKNMAIDNQHWTTNPAAASSATTPSSISEPAAAASTVSTRGS